MFHMRIIPLLFIVLVIPSARSYGDESREVRDWEQVMALEPGTKVWVRSRAAAGLTELVIAQVTEENIIAGVVSEMKESKASDEQILSRCVTPSNSRLIVSGQTVDFTCLCRTLSRGEVLEVQVRKKKTPLRSVLIGSGVAAAIMFAPCGVASQADGSAAGCLVSTAGLGALVGWAIHGLRRGDRVLIYQAEDTEPTWDDLAKDRRLLEEMVRKMRQGPLAGSARPLETHPGYRITTRPLDPGKRCPSDMASPDAYEVIEKSPTRNRVGMCSGIGLSLKTQKKNLDATDNV